MSNEAVNPQMVMLAEAQRIMSFFAIIIVAIFVALVFQHASFLSLFRVGLSFFTLACWHIVIRKQRNAMEKEIADVDIASSAHQDDLSQ